MEPMSSSGRQRVDATGVEHGLEVAAGIELE
jgi:hypothetical protein